MILLTIGRRCVVIDRIIIYVFFQVFARSAKVHSPFLKVLIGRERVHLLQDCTNMDTVKSIFQWLETTLFILIILFALIYSIPIALLPRFHHRNDILTVNVCVATISCCVAWLPDTEVFTSSSIVPRWKRFYISLQVLQTFFTIQVPFSFVLASVHRYCSIVYRKKKFFKTKQWIFLCIASQWVLGAMMSLPHLFSVLLVRLSSLRRASLRTCFRFTL